MATYARKQDDVKNFMIVTMPDSSKWSVPVSVIHDSWWAHYKDNGDVKLKDFDEEECKDWAANNMNWDEVEGVAVELRGEHNRVNYQEGWINGDKEFNS